MKTYTLFLLSVAAMLLSVSACQKTTAYTVPTSYDFKNVNYDRQEARIKMLKELTDYAKSASNIGVPHVDEAIMLGMYQNIGNYFGETTLNANSIQLKNKTNPSLQNKVEECIHALDSASRCLNVFASIGESGVMVSRNNNKRYLLNGNAIELAEVLEKMLVGACFYYQITTVHLGETKMNTDNKRVVDGRGTNMEHYWDEAFGYLGVPIDFPGNTNSLSFLGTYMNRVNIALGCNTRIMNAYLEGRAAISARDYNTRDAMRAILRSELETLLVATTISYLNEAKDNTGDLATYYHNLSEGYGALLGLKYSMHNTLTTLEIDDLLVTLAGNIDPLEANLYNTTAQDIDNVIDNLADAYSSLTTLKEDL